MDYVESQSTTDPSTDPNSNHQQHLSGHKNLKDTPIMEMDVIKSQMKAKRFDMAPVETYVPQITYSLFFQALDVVIEDRVLGKGHYSKASIYSGKFKKSGRPLAIKVITFNQAPDNISKHIGEEINAVRDLRHSNIIRTYEYYIVHGQAFIIMDNVGTVDLHATIKTLPNLEMDEKFFWLCEVLFGIAYLHKKLVCHRDIKPDNIMIKQDNYGVRHAIIVDFGFSIKLKKPNELVRVYCGTRSYKSPEIRRGIPYNPMYSDMWSFGILYLRLMTGKVPFHDMKTVEICDIVKNKFDHLTRLGDGRKMKPTTARVLRDTLIEEPTKRVSARKLLSYEAFSNSPMCKSLYKLTENIQVLKNI